MTTKQQIQLTTGKQIMTIRAKNEEVSIIRNIAFFSGSTINKIAQRGMSKEFQRIFDALAPDQQRMCFELQRGVQNG